MSWIYKCGLALYASITVRTQGVVQGGQGEGGGGGGLVVCGMCSAVLQPQAVPFAAQHKAQQERRHAILGGLLNWQGAST